MHLPGRLLSTWVFGPLGTDRYGLGTALVHPGTAIIFNEYRVWYTVTPWRPYGGIALAGWRRRGGGGDECGLFLDAALDTANGPGDGGSWVQADHLTLNQPSEWYGLVRPWYGLGTPSNHHNHQ